MFAVVGADIDAVVGVGVHGQGVNLGVGLGVSLVVDRFGAKAPPLAARHRSWTRVPTHLYYFYCFFSP